MKFFEIRVRHILVYGHIYDNGMFDICLWDFDVDDYWVRNGYEYNMKAAWHKIYHLARDMDRFNHISDPNYVDEVDAAIELFFDEELDMLNLDE